MVDVLLKMELDRGLITNMIAFAWLFMIFYFSIRTFPVRKKENRLLYALFTMSFIEITWHLVTTYVQYRHFYGYGKVGLIMYSLCISIDAVYMLVWVLLLQQRLKQFGKESVNYNKKLRIMRYPSLLLLVLSFLNIFVPVFFTYDGVEYERVFLYFLTWLIPIGYLVYGICLFILSSHKRRIYQIVPFIPLVAPIALAHIIETIVVEICLVPLGRVMSLMVLTLTTTRQGASIDLLTGLYTRGEMYHYLHDEKAIRKDGVFLYGIMVDLDDFKFINDTYGHHVGDSALVDFGYILRTHIPNDALGFRYAGDEFIVLVYRKTEKEVNDIAQRITDELDHFNNSGKQPYRLAMSYGITLLEYEDSINDFIACMDRRMYQNKASKRKKDVA